jgi:CHASE2 domain-containing sensor protein/predicted Ser/Thr protein kinase
MIGREIGQYRIIGKLGEGGMGEVWLAEDTHLERLVALKSLPLQAVRDEMERERFIREARAAAHINHPNVAQVYEIVDEKEQKFIVMEYLDGGSLRDHLDRAGKKFIPLAQSLEWMRQAAEGLAEAHSQGVIHRDIKPGNLLIDSHGWVKITDFGLAHMATAPRITVSGITMGTLGYVSPEQILGEKVDARSDLFSLGTVLYEVFTRVNPFLCSDINATYYAVLNTVPEPPASYRSELPDDLEKVIYGLIEKDRQKRYQTAGEAADDLAGIQAASGYIPRLDFPGQMARSGVLAGHLKRTRGVKTGLKPLFASIATALAIGLFTYCLLPGYFQQFENQLFDARVRMGMLLEDSHDPGSGLFLIRIDNRSLSKFGRFNQWPRTMHSDLAGRLAGWGASAVFLDLLFSQRDMEAVIDSSIAMQFREAGIVYCPAGLVDRESFVFDSTIDESHLLDNAPHTAIPIDQVSGAGSLPDLSERLALEGPLEQIYRASAGMGLVNLFPDRDAVVRRQPLLMRYGDWVIPTAAFRLYMDVMGVGDDELRLVPGQALYAGGEKIPVDRQGRLLIRWYPPAGPFRELSYYDVYENRIGEPEIIFSEGVCLVGVTAQALGDIILTPAMKMVSGTEIHTVLFSNLSRGDFASAMGKEAGFLLVIIMGALAGWLAFRFSGLFGASLMIILLLLFITASFVAYLNWSYWIEILRPSLGLFFGFAAAAVVRMRSSNVLL